MKRTVALIYGGEGFEHEISLVGAKNISAMISREQYDVIHVLISKTGEWFIEGKNHKTPTFPAFIMGKSGLFTEGKVIPIDVAVPLLHGDLGEDGVILGALRTAHIKTVGCGVLAGAVCADKITAKLVCEALGIPTARWTFSVDKDACAAAESAESTLRYPMFIKPAALGSSIGISKVFSREQFCKAYIDAHLLCERVLIEESVNVKHELECAYLGLSGKESYKIGEILAGGNFYDFEKKYRSETKTETVFTDKTIEKAVTDIADKLRVATGVKQIARFDFFISEDGAVLFNEINTFPGMTKRSLYPSLTVEMGYSEGEFINRLISEALL